jgi:hypothetical protein
MMSQQRSIKVDVSGKIALRHLELNLKVSRRITWAVKPSQLCVVLAAFDALSRRIQRRPMRMGRRVARWRKWRKCFHRRSCAPQTSGLEVLFYTNKDLTYKVWLYRRLRECRWRETDAMLERKRHQHLFDCFGINTERNSRPTAMQSSILLQTTHRSATYNEIGAPSHCIRSCEKCR